MRKKHDHPPLQIIVKVDKKTKVKTYETHTIDGRVYIYHPTKGWRNRSERIVARTTAKALIRL